MDLTSILSTVMGIIETLGLTIFIRALILILVVGGFLSVFFNRNR